MIDMLKEEYGAEKAKDYYFQTDYLLGGELKTRFLFIKVQAISVILFLSPLIFLRLYQGDYKTSFINSSIVLIILLLNQFVHKQNKESYYLALTYIVPLMYSVATYLSLLLNNGDNFALIYIVCSTFFLALRPKEAALATTLFFIAFFSITNQHFDDFKNSKIIISYFLVALIFFAITFQLQKGQKELIKLTRYDSLTNTRNKQVLYEDARRFLHLKGLPGFNQELYMLLVRLEGFDLINEKHGHFSGDNALIALKNCIDESTGIKEVLYHYKQDKFAVISENNEEGVLAIARTIQTSINDFKDAKLPELSISIGIKRLESDEQGVQPWIEGAREALKQAQSISKGGLKLIS